MCLYSKVRRLLTASLSNLQGNPPFTVLFLLRLFAYVHQQDILNEEGQKVSTMKQRAFAAKSLLEHSFSIHTRREAQDGILQKQLRMFSAFSFQLLRHLQLLSPFGEGKNFAEMAIHSSSGANGTLLFIYLMQKKCFHQLIKSYDTAEQAQLGILEVLANLFTNLRMTPFHERSDNLENVQVTLRGLPSLLKPYVEEYNSTVTGLYKRFMAASSQDGNLFVSLKKKSFYDEKYFFGISPINIFSIYRIHLSPSVASLILKVFPSLKISLLLHFSINTPTMNLSFQSLISIRKTIVDARFNAMHLPTISMFMDPVTCSWMSMVCMSALLGSFCTTLRLVICFNFDFIKISNSARSYINYSGEVKLV